jgi:Leucine-rich repeat (LRR) protein
MILLDNCVTSIPDSVCTLPKLRFLALINNPGLKTIPECIVDLPSLYFLNLKGSNNVEVPEAIKAKGTDMGGGMWDLQD